MPDELLDTEPPDARTCPRCGDPLPLDGLCDCTGDCDRDYIAGLADLDPHPVICRPVREPVEIDDNLSWAWVSEVML